MYDKLISALREAHEHTMEWGTNPFRYAALYKKAADAIEELSAKATSKRERGLIGETSPCYSCENKNVYESKYGYFTCNYSGQQCNNKDFPMYRQGKQIAPEPPKEDT